MGTRALANVGAGSPASGGISLNDGAGGFGNPLGTATSSSAVTSQVQLIGTGQAIQLSFSDLIQQVAATANLPGEASSSQITNVFTVSQTGSSLLLAQFAPVELNQVISSVEGSPARNTAGPTQFAESFVSPNLAAGVSYTLSFRSSATEAIQPASTTQVPEPASLALLGLALCGMGYVRRQRAI